MSKANCGGTTVRQARDPLHAIKVVDFAKALLREAQKVLLPTTGEPVMIRVGLHSGCVPACMYARMECCCVAPAQLHSACICCGPWVYLPHHRHITSRVVSRKRACAHVHAHTCMRTRACARCAAAPAAAPILQG